MEESFEGGWPLLRDHRISLENELMKNTKWLLGTFSILLMVSPAGARGAGNEGAQTPASANVQVADIGVVGPGGAVMVFYRDGGDIVVRNCGTDYPKVNQRSDCKVVGKENRVPVEAFKMELKANFLILDPNKLKPLTPAELKAYEKGDPNRMAQLAARKEESQKQLDRIQAFIRDRYKGKLVLGSEILKTRGAIAVDPHAAREPDFLGGAFPVFLSCSRATRFQGFLPGGGFVLPRSFAQSLSLSSSLNAAA